MQARKLDLRFLSNSNSSAISSLLVEPFSRSIAAKLSDSSLLLFPPLLDPLSTSNRLYPTVIPPISSSSCFLRLQISRSSKSQILFLCASAESGFILLRGWVLRTGTGNDNFVPVLLGLKPDSGRLGLLLEHRHGFSISLAGTVNFFVLHCSAEEKIFVYGAKMVGEVLNLVKCAVIECSLPIFTAQLGSGFLLLGEMAGVRVFPLRPLVKGKAGKKRNPRSTRRENAVEEVDGLVTELNSGKIGELGLSG